MELLTDAAETVYAAITRSILDDPLVWGTVSVFVGCVCLFLVIAHPRIALRGAALGTAASAFYFLCPVLIWELQAGAEIRGSVSFLALMGGNLTQGMVIVVLALCPCLGVVAGGAAGFAGRSPVRPGRVVGVTGQAGAVFTGLLLTGAVLLPYLSETELLPPLVAGMGFTRVTYFPSLLVIAVIVALVMGTLAGLADPGPPMCSTPAADGSVTPDDAWPTPPHGRSL
jgi:hypothetical protein